MSSTFRSSYDESSTDSIESFGIEESNTSAKDTHGSAESIPRSSLQIQTPMALIRSDSHPQLHNIQPHQHATLFYLSLIEGRCRTQAASAINAGRDVEDQLPEDHPEVHDLAQHLFGEMTKELHKAGVLPNEFAGQELSEVRQSYLLSFDNILHNIAAERKHEFQDAKSYSSLFDRSNAYQIGRDSASRSITNGKAFASQNYDIMAPSADFLSSGVSGLSLRPPAIFKSKFKRGRRIGKGGFGKVYGSSHHLDGHAYAVKKIVMDGKAATRDSTKALVAEIRALADLSHRNIVRYYNSWFETRPIYLREVSSSGSESEGETDGEGQFSASTNAGSVDSRNFDPAAGLFAEKTRTEIAQKRGLAKDARRVRFKSRSMRDKDYGIKFEYSTPSEDNTSLKDKALVGPIQSKFFQRSDSSSSEDDVDGEDTEEVSRSDYNPLSGLDVIIYIQMSLHPTNLEKYLWPKPQKPGKEARMQHCFHTIPTARILLGVLDGVEYIHRNKIVHRDLKPANIMLSTSRDAANAIDGYINMSDCADCKEKSGHQNSQELYIIPHIGDFGLVADIQDTDSKSSTTLSVNDALVPKAVSGSFMTPVLSRVSSRQAGTRFYSAPRPSNGKAIICPKLDVYSLGVIAFEMVYQFGTRTERGIVLDKLSKGEFPKQFETHEMAEGIKKALCRDRQERWGCAEVREWLQGFVGV